jgi:hypothetical protein
MGALFRYQKNHESSGIAANLQITGIFFETKPLTMAENGTINWFYTRTLSVFSASHFMMQNM